MQSVQAASDAVIAPDVPLQRLLGDLRLIGRRGAEPLQEALAILGAAGIPGLRFCESESVRRGKACDDLAHDHPLRGVDSEKGRQRPRDRRLVEYDLSPRDLPLAFHAAQPVLAATDEEVLG